MHYNQDVVHRALVLYKSAVRGYIAFQEARMHNLSPSVCRFLVSRIYCTARPLKAEYVVTPDNVVNVTTPNLPRSRPQTLKLIVRGSRASEWSQMAPRGLIGAYLQLSKHRLTMLITTSAMSGVVMAPVPLDWRTLGYCALGTTLMSASANAFNHLLEAPYDAQMKRTQSRVLVTHRFSPLHAFTFAGVTSVAGATALWLGCNPLAAGLGLLNVFLYAGVYTPMKRYHIGCTWAGAVVGAIPPLMGYAAMTGGLDAGALVLAAIHYSWQFPHFNGLSWNLRGDYSRAGYRVMCVTDEDLCRKTTMRHAVGLLGLCSVAAPCFDLTPVNFALESIPLNAILIYLSYKFYKSPDSKNSRTLFRYSLLYLPLIMVLMGISQKGRSDSQRGPDVAQLPGHSILKQ
ncbi:unnamed protein product [Bursaphelenchus xylophilus]|uniref:Protoheme IX farnesyltransferase, mitochondrial n=1 Tax=Bursaphelenchus xylophilus TaxID=6326 RepID=A0A1I7RHA5_BURXY|nr:unnamed protein product [Bursaphelenchus xylophilus]CAG9115894.1 unnamed protein product [Bursaphelenchus xylophilus]